MCSAYACGSRDRCETVSLVTDVSTSSEFVQAAFAAAAALKAQCYELKLNTVFSLTHTGNETVLETKGAVDMLKKANLVLVFHVALGTEWLKSVLAAGARVLYVTDTPDVLERVMPVPGLKEAAIYARDLLANAKELRLTNEGGTDFYCKLGKMTASCQYGAADLAGRVDGWGRGHFSTYANPGTAQGKVVLQPGDCWIFPYVRSVEATTTLTIEDSVIINIEGSTDAVLMRQFLGEHARVEGNNGAYHVSHLGWGLHPDTPRDQLAIFGNDIKRAGIARGWPGVFLFSTGPNNLTGPGSNKTKAHIDLPMFRCSVKIDGKTVISDGEIVDPKMIVPPTRELRLGH